MSTSESILILSLVIESSYSQAMLNTSSDTWLATSFFNLLNDNLSKALLIAWSILLARLYWDPDNAPSSDPEENNIFKTGTSNETA